MSKLHSNQTVTRCLHCEIETRTITTIEKEHYCCTDCFPKFCSLTNRREGIA